MGPPLPSGGEITNSEANASASMGPPLPSGGEITNSEANASARMGPPLPSGGDTDKVLFYRILLTVGQ